MISTLEHIYYTWPYVSLTESYLQISSACNTCNYHTTRSFFLCAAYILVCSIGNRCHKDTRPSTSGRKHSATYICFLPSQNSPHSSCPKKCSTWVRCSSPYSSAAAVPQCDYTSTAVLPVLKDKQWFRNNNKVNASEFDLTQMSKQEQKQVSCRLEVSTLYCSLALALCLYAFLPQQYQVLYSNCIAKQQAYLGRVPQKEVWAVNWKK